MRGKIAIELLSDPVFEGTRGLKGKGERQLILGEPVEEVCFPKCAPFTRGTVLQLPNTVRQALDYQKVGRADFDALSPSQCV
jgi:hypothetical protein